MRAATHLLILFALAAVLPGCTSLERVARAGPSPLIAMRTPPAPTPPASVDSPPPCPVTVANGSTPPRERPSSGHHGSGGLWTALWPDGTVVFKPGGSGSIEPDRSLAMKWPWWRGPALIGMALTIEGRRLDQPARPLRADIPSAYQGSAFQATALIFPTTGCWEVTGRAGDATLTFVVLVVRLDAGERRRE